MEKAKQVFNLGRKKMIALALLCGCDYDDGITGVGKEAALKFFKRVDDDEVFERWTRNESSLKIKKPVEEHLSIEDE